MKRLTLLTILLVVVGLTAGAIEIKPTFSLSGSGTLEWGIDLDTQATGFLNSAASSLSLTWIADSSDTHAGKDGFYGSITLSGVLAIAADDAIDINDPTVAAKIVGMGGNLVIGVYGAPDLALDFVPAVEADADAVDAVVDNEAELATDYATYGTYVSYTVSEALMLGLEVVSEGDWTTNAAQAYAFALDVQAKFAPLTINAGVNYGVNYASTPMGFGVKVAADTAMVDPWVAFDGQYDAAFAWEVGAGASFALMEGVSASLAALFDSADNFDLMVTFAEAAAKGLVDGLDASLTVYLLDLITAIEYEVIFTAGYDTGKLYPHFGVTYGDDNAAAATLSAFVHVNYDLFEAAPTVLYVEWDSGDLLSSVMGTVVVGVTVTY